VNELLTGGSDKTQSGMESIGAHAHFSCCFSSVLNAYKGLQLLYYIIYCTKYNLAN